MKVRQNNALGELGMALGIGLMAGVAGTAAITLSQLIEMAITKRKPSDAALKVAEQTVEIKPVSEEFKEQVSWELHWAYGTAWGVARGLLSLTGLKGLPAAAAHFAAIWGASLVILPKYDAGTPIDEETPKAIAIDAFHHAVYATAATLVYDALNAGTKKQRKADSLLKTLKKIKIKELLAK